MGIFLVVFVRGVAVKRPLIKPLTIVLFGPKSMHNNSRGEKDKHLTLEQQKRRFPT